MTRSCRVGLLLLGVCTGLGDRVSAQQPRVVGIVTEIVPPVYLRLVGREAEVALDPAKDAARAVLEGEAIRTGPGGRARVAQPGQRQVTVVPVSGAMTFPTTGVPMAARVTLDALNAYGRPGGSRGINARVFSPADQSVVRVSALVVRWNARSNSAVRIELRTATGISVWSAAAAGPQGRLPIAETAALRAALRRAEGADAGLDAWVIRVSDDAGVMGTSTFKTLPMAAQRGLIERLGNDDREPDPLLRAIGQSFTFQSFALENEAADVLDDALALVPRSQAMLRAVIAAQTRIGNLIRAQTLSAQLDPQRDDVPGGHPGGRP